MKNGYFIALIAIGFTFALLIFISAGNGKITDFNSNDNSYFTNMTYGKCVHQGVQQEKNCIVNCTFKFEFCKGEIGDEGSRLEECGLIFKNEKKLCKKNYKMIKDECSLHRKTLLEILKERV
ncbi:hypothetical protein J4218_03685 [Candidatus Pacearchaeota archaeon]|nr:hypothetical protein [Candidatus Pacearchaeota archaeon]